MSSPLRILVTRAPHQASELADHLRALGADPILIPTIELTEPTSFTPLDEALANLATYNWLLFTSANAVQAFAQRMALLSSAPQLAGVEPLKKPHASGRASFVGAGLQPRRKSAQEEGASAPEGMPRIAAIGAATARALSPLGLTPDLIPPQAIAESLTEALLPHAQPGTRFLLIRAESARDHLPETLIAAGAEVTIAPAYRTVAPAGSSEALETLFAEAPPDAITFTSSSSARNLFALIDRIPPTVTLASIGPVTSATLRELGHSPHMESTSADVRTLATELMAYLACKG